MNLFCGHTRTPRALLRRMLRSLRDERGFTLAMALGLMTSLSMAGATVTVYATGNLKGSASSNASASAYALAEAGINNALAVLYNQLDEYGAVKSPGGIDPRTPTLLASKTLVYPEVNGSVTYSGTIDANYVWTITSTGTMKAGQTLRTKMLKKTVAVMGINSGADGTSWSRFYQDSTSSCLTIDTVTMPASVSTRGPLCLINGGAITGAASTIDVGGTVSISGPGTPSGPRNPTAGSGWTSSTNIYSSDNLYATNSVGANTTGATLNATGFGFTIPTNTLIKGISITVERKAGVSNALRDYQVYLLKAGAQSGSNHADTYNYWGTSDYTDGFGSSSDMWGTTWTAAQVNATNFGAKFVGRNYTGSAVTASVDRIQVTVYYTADTNGVGTSGTPIQKATIGSSCTYNANAAHNPCTSADHVYANAIEMVPLASNPALAMPEVDLSYWWENAKPGPKHFCTNASPGLSTSWFDNDAGSTSDYNRSVWTSPEVTPTGTDYTCQVVENGVTVGELSWNHTTHVLTINGTIFVDGDFRFDDEGQVVHYAGRGIIYTAGDVEFDETVCAGGTGTSSCITTGMSSWNPFQNMMVILSAGNSEYDQGGTACSPSGTATCPNGKYASGFQGVVYAKGDCLIHEQFKLSGPVICNTLSLPYESDGWPQYFSYPSLGELVDGQKYSDTAEADHFEFQQGSMSGG
jgi:hypothetical protein